MATSYTLSYFLDVACSSNFENARVIIFSRCLLKGAAEDVQRVA